ncbi:MAG: putative quinol monooxygenase [Saprospiraceae bacterium]
MIKRIVKLSFQPEKIADFLTVFEQSKKNISNFDGCHHLELFRCTAPNNLFFTYSFWENEAALNAYRHSEFFQATWRKTKVLFNDRPEAWSVEVASAVKIHPEKS